MAAKQRQSGLDSLDAAIGHPRIQAWAQLAGVYHRIARHLEQALDADGVTLPQFEVLARLHLDGAISQKALAERLLVTKGNISGLLNRMAAARLVVRQRDAGDRRMHRLVLTARGKQMFARTFPKHISLIHQVMKALQPREVQSLSAALDKLPTSGVCTRPRTK
jgi:DNA-binding MarR family transcriptional regulator